MNFNKSFQAKTFKVVLWGIAGLIVSLLVFKAGTIVGFRKAGFSYKWGENYHRNFAGPRRGFFNNFSDKNFIGGHGVFGQIIKIDAAALIIKGRDDVEKIVLVKDDAAIKRFRNAIKLSDLKIDDYIVVIGDPNEDGQIEAKFIRLAPPPPEIAPFGSPPPRRGR